MAVSGCVGAAPVSFGGGGSRCGLVAGGALGGAGVGIAGAGVAAPPVVQPHFGQVHSTVHSRVGVSFVTGHITSLFTARTRQWQQSSQPLLLLLLLQHSSQRPHAGVTGGRQMYLHWQP
jgi:hypothetical protein